MPYKSFRKDGRYCIKNVSTNKVTCFRTLADESKGIRIREAFAHGWKPSRLKRK